ncbi:MAG: alanine racemase [Lactobacillaceae bacterium]|jgi:alanine racemase|nr:alanine racemase [Lactobacillaceae bacterium]
MEYSAQHRRAQLILSKAAVAHNIQVIKANADAKVIMAVIKANAFAHGLAEMAELSVAGGATRFGVALLDEALALRELGYQLPIDVLGLTQAGDTKLAAELDITLAVSSVATLQAILAELDGTDLRLRVSLPVDTGLNRIGFKTRAELVQAIELLQGDAHVIYQSLWTHFATADTPNEAYVDFQVAEWDRLTHDLPAQPLEQHFANTGIATWYPNKVNTDIIRLGVGLYGLDSSEPTMPMPFALAPVLSLTAAVSFSKPVHAGEHVGYGATYVVSHDGWLVTLPLGHADGYPFNADGMRVLFANGAVGQIVGGVAMDQMMVFVAQEVLVDTVATLIGRVEDAEITLGMLAEYTQTNIMAVMNRFAPRLKRVIGE